MICAEVPSHFHPLFLRMSSSFFPPFVSLTFFAMCVFSIRFRLFTPSGKHLERGGRYASVAVCACSRDRDLKESRIRPLLSLLPTDAGGGGGGGRRRTTRVSLSSCPPRHPSHFRDSRNPRPAPTCHDFKIAGRRKTLSRFPSGWRSTEERGKKAVYYGYGDIFVPHFSEPGSGTFMFS